MLRIKELYKKVLNKEIINSFLIAVLCTCGLISFIIGKENTIPIIEIIVFIIMELINFKDTKEKLKKFEFKNYVVYISLFLFVLILFISTFIMHGFRSTVVERLLFFIGFICIPFLCCRHKNNINKIIEFILLISGIIAIPLFNIKLGYFDGGTRMSISYYMLPTYLAMVMSFFVDKNRKLKKTILKIIIFITLFFPYVSFFVEYISRGVVLAVAVCILLCIIIKKSTKFKVISIISLLVFSIIFLGFLLKPTLTYTQSILDKYDIRVEIITKSFQLMESGSLDNGRNEVYDKAIDGIKKHPIIGNGIGDYAYKYVTYPHNLILQAWYEGGILFFILMTFIVLYSIYIFIFDKEIKLEQKYILILFFSQSIIRLMLSYEFWKEISFGMYLFIILNIIQEKTKMKGRKKYGNSNNTNV